ncbi:hypothetical protein [Anaeromyxobacter oryzisoli]|uniref:hypothetical protein n=1 Tax=Anaeromyxobacter oryzisoli TaxID=2925408 RepID=UPI001F59BF50|nr:hypothetical protein [Anaeromyxobacter sp. SG63]
MTRDRIALLCLALAVGGAALALHASTRIRSEERTLAALTAESRAAGRSFVETLQGEHAERQKLLFEQRRRSALALAAARRDRLLGVLLLGASALAAGALKVMHRLAVEVAAVDAAAADRGPPRS